MRLYQILLHLYPAAFRGNYAREMTGVLEQSLRRARGLERLAVWANAILDICVNAPSAHCDLLRQDLRYCMRSLLRAPSFAFTVAAMTAIAVGASSAVLTLAHRVFLEPLPFRDPGQLVRMWERKPGYGQMELSPPNYRDWKATAVSFESMAAWRGRAANLTGMQQPVHLEGAAITAELFDVLGVRPLLGRGFTPEDDLLTSPRSILLSESLWKEQFGQDPTILGRTVSLDNQPHIVIGVMPAWVRFPSRSARYWTAMRFDTSDFADRGNNYLDAVARLKPGVSIDQARSEMSAITANLERAYPKDNEKTGATVIGLADQIGAKSRTMIGALGAATFCFFLVASLNLASLFLARALARRRELAIRTALGASADRLVRQLATESLMLSATGGALGLLLGWAILPFLGRLVPLSLPVELPGLDWRMAMASMALSIVAGWIFGVVPAVRVCRRASLDGLREGGRQGAGGTRQRARSVLVTAEVALSVVLLVSGGLLVRSMWNIQSINPGFRTDGVLTMRTPLPMPKYERTAQRSAYYDRVLRDIRALPGVKHAGYISFLPILMRGGIWPVAVRGDAGNRAEGRSASLRFITPGFFDTLQIKVRLGRDVSESDTMDTSLVAVVSESFARRHWPNEDPLGRKFQVAFAERTVAGVVPDIKVRGLEQQSEPQVYLPYRQAPDGVLTWYAPKDLVVAAGGDAASLTPAIREIIRRADADQPVTNVQYLDEVVRSDTAARRLQVQLLAGFAMMTLLLSGLGLYGLMSYSVSQRTQEFGIRMALGAQRHDVFGLVFRHSLVLTTMGAVTGVVLAIVPVRGLEALLFGVSLWDATSWVAAVMLCFTAAMLGAVRPAVRAAAQDPLTAMRTE
ncbi:MAG: ABC transporter permease [Bryobacterales bacterium]|nr:ABC transporter permease [Bryobacterales bacterium]